jgi:hypothetical protein
MRPEQRTLKRTGIDWNVFFSLAGMRAVYTLSDDLLEPAVSAAIYRGYTTETLSHGDGTSVLLIKRETEVDRIITELMALGEKALRAIHAAAGQAGLIKKGAVR